MGQEVVLDTNVLLKVYNREPGYEGVTEILDSVDQGEVTAVVSAITVAEIAVGYHMSGDERGLKAFVLHLRSSGNYVTVDVDVELAELAGRIRAETGLRLPDAIIAATGVTAGASQVITEDKQFKKVSAFIPSLTPDEFLGTLR